MSRLAQMAAAETEEAANHAEKAGAPKEIIDALRKSVADLRDWANSQQPCGVPWRWKDSNRAH